MSRSRVLTSRFRDRVLVTLKAGETFDGILYSCDDRAIVLKQVAAVGVAEDKSDLPADGEIILLMDNIAWIQRP